MNEETIAFPQYVDNYAPMMFWEADDLIPFIIGLEGGEPCQHCDRPLDNPIRRHINWHLCGKEIRSIETKQSVGDDFPHVVQRWNHPAK